MLAPFRPVEAPQETQKMTNKIPEPICVLYADHHQPALGRQFGQVGREDTYLETDDEGYGCSGRECRWMNSERIGVYAGEDIPVRSVNCLPPAAESRFDGSLSGRTGRPSVVAAEV